MDEKNSQVSEYLTVFELVQRTDEYLNTLESYP